MNLLAQGSKSPCIQLCKLNTDKVCTGCGRSLSNISAWSGALEPERQAIVAEAALRLNAMGWKRQF
jgi:predicted Fe-S protein YdhL (DUF1289 family)